MVKHYFILAVPMHNGKTLYFILAVPMHNGKTLYFILAVPMHNGKTLCMSSTFAITILNGTYFFRDTG